MTFMLSSTHAKFNWTNMPNKQFFIVFFSIDKTTQTQLPPPPTIELIVDKRHLLGILKRPIVRVRRKYPHH